MIDGDDNALEAFTKLGMAAAISPATKKALDPNITLDLIKNQTQRRHHQDIAQKVQNTKNLVVKNAKPNVWSPGQANAQSFVKKQLAQNY